MPNDDKSLLPDPAKNQANIPFVYKGNSNFGANSSFFSNVANIKIEPVTTFNPNINGDPNSVPNSVGRRLLNPLGFFASYTYNVSLYMLSADAYDAFLNTGRQSIQAFTNLTSFTNGQQAAEGGGVFLVAQSGGINGNYENRAPGFELDYYIDDLVMAQFNPGAGTSQPTGEYDVSFKIHEPYGFSLFTSLTQAASTLMAYNNNLSSNVLGDRSINGLKMQFVIGLRFYGYDIAGNPIQATENVLGGVNESGSSLKAGVFERFFDITISDANFKLGKGSVYEFKAKFTPQIATGLKYGHVPVSTTVEGLTVLDCLYGSKGLINTLNAQQQKLFDEGKITEKINYFIKFMPGAEGIGNAPMFYDGNNSEQMYNNATSGATNTQQSNPYTEFRSFPDNSTKTLTIVNDTPILTAIETIVKESSFMTTSFLRMQDNLELKRQNPDIILDNTQPLYWFSVTAELRNPRWDSKTSSWAYDILYMVERFEVPFLYLDNVVPGDFYGVQKSYNYYFTGENTEVISYEQDIKLGYMVNVVDLNISAPNSDTAINNRPSGQSSVTSVNLGLAAQNQVTTQIYDDSSFAKATIQILGDPDYLASTSTSIDSLYDRLYGPDGFTIKPTGGRNFIEIVFYEAKDYSTESGVMDINRSLGLTTRSDPSISKGIVYEIVTVTSKFSKGKFTQELKLIIKDTKAVADQIRAKAQGDISNQGTANTASGLKVDKAIGNLTIANLIEGSGLRNPFGLGPTSTSSSDDNRPTGKTLGGPTVYDYGPGAANPFNPTDPFNNPFPIGSGLKGWDPYGP